jgi:hypothetical protein
MKPGFTILNVNPNGKQWNGKTQLPQEGEIQECVIIRKNHGHSLLEFKGSVLAKFLPRETS